MTRRDELSADEYLALPTEDPPPGYSFRRILGTRTVHVTAAYPGDNYSPLCGASLGNRMTDIAEFRRGGDRRCPACFSHAGIYDGPKATPRPGSVAASVACSCCPNGFDPATHRPATVRR